MKAKLRRSKATYRHRVAVAFRVGPYVLTITGWPR